MRRLLLVALLLGLAGLAGIAYALSGNTGSGETAQNGQVNNTYTQFVTATFIEGEMGGI